MVDAPPQTIQSKVNEWNLVVYFGFLLECLFCFGLSEYILAIIAYISLSLK